MKLCHQITYMLTPSLRRGPVDASLGSTCWTRFAQKPWTTPSWMREWSSVSRPMIYPRGGSVVNMIGTFSLVQLGTCLNLILCNAYLHVQRNNFIWQFIDYMVMVWDNFCSVLVDMVLCGQTTTSCLIPTCPLLMC